MVWYTRLVSKLAAAATSSSSSSTLFKKLSIQNRPTPSKLGETSSTVFKNFTPQNHPKQKHSLSNHLVGYKSPPLIISSNNVFMVKHYSTSYDTDRELTLGEDLRRRCRKALEPLVMMIGLLTYIIYTGRGLETKPYTNRTHYVFLPPEADKVLAERFFNKDELGALPEKHPDSVRVKSIGDQIVKALESDLEAKKKRVESISVGHLVGIEWEFVVVDVNDSKFTSASVPGGKVCVSSDLLMHLDSDAKIATIIGHEVAHIVARHNSSGLNESLRYIDFANEGLEAKSSPKMAEHNPLGVSELGRLLFTYPGTQRNKMEADHIGLLIMASAGFDPQEAPKVYAMLDQLPSSSSLTSGKKRAEYLAQAKVMEEAKSIYSKTIESRKMKNIKNR